MINIMVIKLKSKSQHEVIPAPIQNNKFTIQEIDELFSNAKKDWNAFYVKNESKFWEKNLDIYDWCVYPCVTKDEDDIFYRCVLHPQVTVNCGNNKTIQFNYKNIHYSELISHCVFYEPEKHKQYIIEKLFGSSHVSTNNNE